MKSYVKKVVVLVVFLNLVQLCYFLFNRVPGPGHTVELRSRRRRGATLVAAKNWSEVPSYRAWTPDPEVVPDNSCEAYFGNGFWRVLDDVGGSFRCHHSPTLRTSVCQGQNVVMHPSRIDMSVGGEEIDEVRGRDEDQELPVFKDGAFEIQVSDEEAGKGLTLALDLVMPQGQVHRHTLRSLLRTLRTVSARRTDCSEVVKIPTLFVTRFEYANLFHTVTDWYSSYASSRVIGLDLRPAVVLVDGHSESAMDDGWRAFFSDVKYAKHFGDRTICFDQAIFVPLGYDTALFKFLSTGLPCSGAAPADLDLVKTSRLREFGEQFTSSFSGISTSASAGQEEFRVLFIRREDYLAHPRHTGKPETRLSNEAELYDKLVSWAAQHSHDRRRVSITNGLFAHMKLAEQVKAVQEASVIVGVHGAGLTHIVFARPSTVVIEILSPLFMRPHYQFISQWMGIEYHYIVMDDITVNCEQVIERLNDVLQQQV